MISYCKNGKSAQVLACPQEKLNEILDSPEVAVACQKLTTVDHDSDEAKTLKQGLPLLMFLANYTDGRRHAKSAVPTNMAYLDLDELNGEDPREVWKRLVQNGIGASDSISTRELFGQGAAHRVYHPESVRPSVANRAHRPVETMAGCSTWCDR